MSPGPASPAPAAVLPAHPALRPGTRWARCGPGHWQIDLPPTRAVLDAGPGVRTLLEALAGNAVDDALLARLDAWPAHDGPAPARALATLVTAGLVVDGEALLVSVHGPAPAVRAAAWAAASRDGAEVLRRRCAAGAVVVSGASPVAPTVVSLLTRAGCRARQAPPDRPTRGRTAPAVVVDLAAGEPERLLLDAWSRAGVAHLPVADHGTHARLGPFTVPGSTACLRCCDALAAGGDPGAALVTSQHAGPPRGLLVPEDPAVRSMLTGWVVRDVLAHLDGHRPTTWSAVVELDPRGVPVPRSVVRHPRCGCAWDLAG